MPRRPKFHTRLFWLALVSAALVLAADPAWRVKPIQSWTEEDAKQVLTESPWVKNNQAVVNRLQTEDQRREGGNMGEEHGVGYDGLAKDRLPIPKNIVGLFLHPPASRPLPQIALQVFWQSAFPFRAAELKVGVNLPTLAGEGYKIAVYGIPNTDAKGDPKALGRLLNIQAFLRRDGKKDVRASRCEVFRKDDVMLAVYLFPLSAEITKKDGLIEFDARIGRIAVVQFFNIPEMELQGKLDL
ncbi:MAG TPA: hypothetical protein VGG72_33670 [Bryobacteraceae bacterium]